MESKYIFLTSKDHLLLAQEEIQRLYSTKVLQITQATFSLQSSQNLKEILFLATRLAFTTKIFLVKKQIFSINETEVLSAIEVKDILPEYKINLEGQLPSTLIKQDFIDAIYFQTNSQKVNLVQPKQEYAFFWTKDSVFFTEQIFKNEDKPSQRRSHLKEHNHPTSIHPKLARAIINLAGTKSFHDPFCGAGGMVIEGALMGLDVQGSDIMPLMIERAKINAKKDGVDVPFFVQDALQITKITDAFIADLPYGRNSSISTNTAELTKNFLTIAYPLTKKLVLCVFEALALEELAKENNWLVKFTYSFYVHKSLTRKIVVLEHS